MDNEVKILLLKAYINGKRIEYIDDIPENKRKVMSIYGTFYPDMIKERSYELNDRGVNFCENIINEKSSHLRELFKIILTAIATVIATLIIQKLTGVLCL